jgi:molybdate transport system substrate-binding protein
MKAFLLAAIHLLAAGVLGAENITVFAAASLTDALSEIGSAHEKAGGGKVRFNFAASSTLARQIEAGAPADVFFSADEAQMDGLAAKGLIDKTSRKNLLGNTLVVVTAPDGPSVATLADLGGPVIRRLSMGDPRAVPAGLYARQHFEKLGLWQLLASKVAPAANVRTALAVVESGNAQAGIVYKTDAMASGQVKVALEIPAAEGPAIIYPVALVAGSRHAEGARGFLERLAGDEAAEVFRKHGFVVIEGNK